MNNTFPVQVQEVIDWLNHAVATSGLSKVIIGVSGGVDSAVSAALATKALGVKNVYLVLLPYDNLNAESVQDGMLLAEFLQIPKDQIFTIDIKDSVDSIFSHMNELDNIRKGNVMARVRMIYLFDLAKKLGALVCGTENKTEYFLGYFTRFGDEASDIEPIRDFYKTQVWEIAKKLGLPNKIIENAPTAGLWEGQTDEQELGFSYQDADTVLTYHFDQGLTAEQIVEKGLAKETVVNVLERVAKNDFKHKLPYINK